ncbi:MAG TPA: hypothetical protein P5086_01985 [Prolixibacteraceae bacterium]|nr:hypothetical protein [Prolixibacteraceae bacterium]HRV88059.1 hypothetical protein [Prolixibacteraceae bacterium]
MAKVFRLHEGAAGTGWFVSQPLTPAQLTTIRTEGKEVATSIPSPYARIDLVKSAFRWVTDHGLEGSTAYHRLVSETLDVAQLFFLSQKYRSRLAIVAYDPVARFKALEEDDGILRHNHLAETLRLYWEQDSVARTDAGNLVLYNFEHVKRIYLLLNRSTGQVIGGTSPATLFLPAPDAREAGGKLGLRSSDHTFFGDVCTPLSQREPSFVRYLFALAKQPRFPLLFPELFAYLEKVRMILPDAELTHTVTNLDAGSLSGYRPCPVGTNPNDACEVLGIPLGLRDEDEEEGGINETSDFTLVSDFPMTGRRPLILPQGRFPGEWTYTTPGIRWNENNVVPWRNDHPEGESLLPVQEDAYPWLSAGNFLDDKIIELPYPVDATRFELCGAHRCLLPLTPLFFRYFRAESANRMLTLSDLAGGGTEALLEIPVKGGKIRFRKVYSLPDKVKSDLHLAIVPFVRSEKKELPYTIGILDDGADEPLFTQPLFFEEGEPLPLSEPVFRNRSRMQRSYYFRTPGRFDALRLNTPQGGGCLIPRWKASGKGYHAVKFAVDFGTTNTHIEYQYGNHDARALDITASQPLWQSLIDTHHPEVNFQDVADDRVFEQEIMPYLLLPGEKVHFPLRTALACNRDLDPGTQPVPFLHVNNYMLYEKIHFPVYLDIRTQLKWSNYADLRDETLVESYIGLLVLLVYYKTLALGGDPAQTTITWFYPVSMDEYELGVLFRTWKKAYMAVFGLEPTGNRINGIPESIAPYLYYKSAVIGQSLSVDIGGGSTDIALFDENSTRAKMISSFKFAGNAIFGDGFPTGEFRNNSDRNGYVRTFATRAREAVSGDTLMQPILENILQSTKDSADFSSLLFALEGGSRSTFSYTRLLESHKRMKLPILIFYAALAYYSAQLLRRSGERPPRYILFSGTASKTAAILDTSAQLAQLSALFTYFFGKVFGEEIPPINLQLSPIPKEITCKGALKVGVGDNITGNTIRFWIGGNQEDLWSSALDKEKQIAGTPKYREVTSEVKLMIESSVRNFYTLLDAFTGQVNLEGAFNIELQAYERFRRMREDNIGEYLIRGLRAFFKKEEKHIEETLFFYPLIGILNKLSFELSEITP